MRKMAAGSENCCKFAKIKPNYLIIMARIRHIFIILLMILWVSVAKAQPASDVNDSITVTGQVIDRTDNDQPLIGASISEKGTSNRTTTDFDGRFIIKVPMGATLVASYIGLGTAEVLVDGEPILIRMLPQKFRCGPVCTSPYGIPDWGYKGVEGIIYDQDGHRLKGATVTLLPSGKSVKSDNDGYFSFDDKKDDTIVRVECSGYEPVQGEIQDNWITVRMDP